MKYLFFLLLPVLCRYSYSQNPNWLWAKCSGGIDNDFGGSLVSDNMGNLLVTGIFTSPTITFGSYTLINSDATNIFIVKYDGTGNIIWAKNTANDSSSIYNPKITLDNSGNFYLTGFFEGSFIIFGSDTLRNFNTANTFIVKYDDLGNVIWAKCAGGNAGSAGCGIKTDTIGNVYVTGIFSGPYITIENFTLTNAGIEDLFVLKMDVNGNALWVKNFGGSGEDFATGICTDVFGYAYLTGYFYSTSISFGNITLTNIDSSTENAFIVKFDSIGNILWAKNPTGRSGGQSIATDKNGNVFIAGIFEDSTITFGSYTLINASMAGAGIQDAFIVKYDANGNVVWANSAGGMEDDGATSIASDKNGNVYMTGYYMATAIFGNDTLPFIEPYWYENIFGVKYNANGNVIWVKNAGGLDLDVGWDIGTDPAGNVYITGWFNSPFILFGTDTLTNADNTGNSSDIFIAKLGSGTGIQEFGEIGKKFFVAPNPTPGLFTIKGLTIDIGFLEIYNILGEKVYSTSNITRETPVKIDLSQQPEGIYNIRLTTDGGFMYRRVVIIR